MSDGERKEEKSNRQEESEERSEEKEKERERIQGSSATGKSNRPKMVEGEEEVMIEELHKTHKSKALVA